MSMQDATGWSKAVGIQSRAMKLLAWTVFFCVALLAFTGLIVLQFNTELDMMSVGETGSSSSSVSNILLLVVVGGAIFVLTPLVGLIILYRSSNWQIGWLLTTWSGFFGLSGFSQVYAEYAFLVRPEAPLPLKWPAAWFQHSVQGLAFGLLVIVLPQIFPTGRPLSPRWRVVFRLSMVYLALITVLLAFARGPIAGAPAHLGLINPYGFVPLGEPGKQGTLANRVFGGSFFIFSMLAIVSLALRYRRSRGDERQQIKWIAYTLSMWAIGFMMNTVGDVNNWPFLEVPGWVIWQVGILGLPLAMGFAILKYRLYDIDRIINRTLVYGALTAALALVYFSSVVLLQQVLPSESPIAIVISTLAIAALFSPLRRRIQNAIDRRFYRQKYDAQQTLAAFSIRMRDEVELGRLSETLLAVVEETMQPAHVSLWLKRSVGN